MDGILFRCRINNIDHYQGAQFTEFDPPLPLSSDRDDERKRPKVSVLRAFGATESGQKVLMHIHGVFQYTYVEYIGSLAAEDVAKTIQILQTSIDHALAISLRQNPYEKSSKYVAYISLVKGVPFYGYHVGYKFFFKIYLLNPLHMTRLADLLREGAVMKRVIQPYESHMQYIAQWMCDYNLYGCAFLECAKVKFRGPVPNYYEIGHVAHIWHDESIPSDLISDEAYLPKQSHCALEIDIRAEDIVNRHSIVSRDLHHDFIERTAPLPIDKKLVQSMAGLWKDETRRRKARMGLRDKNSSPFSADVLISMSADPRHVGPGGWVHEEELRAKIAQIAASEAAGGDGTLPTFEEFVKPLPDEDAVQTAFESVEDLYSANMVKLVADQQATQKSRGADDTDITKAVVDENRISSPELQRKTHVVDHAGESPPLYRDDLEDDLHNSSDTEMKEGIDLSDFASFGVRKVGEQEVTQDDYFVIPKSMLGPRKRKRPTQKRTRFEEPADASGKKQRNGNGTNLSNGTDHSESTRGPAEEQLFELLDPQFEGKDEYDVSLDAALRSAMPDSEPAPPNSLPTRSSQNSVLSFPVVKNANDPNTIKRLSQRSKTTDSTPTNPSEKTPATKNTMGLETNKTDSTVSRLRTETKTPLVRPLRFRGMAKKSPGLESLCYAFAPPSARHVNQTMSDCGKPDAIYRSAHYGREKDVPRRAVEYAGRSHRLQSTTVPYLPVFDKSGESSASYGIDRPSQPDFAAEKAFEDFRRKTCTHKRWSIAVAPPTKRAVSQYFASNTSKVKTHSQKNRERSQIQLPTQANAGGYKYSSRQESTSVQHETQYMNVMALELHVNTRGRLVPDPELDAIACVFWCVQSDDNDIVENTDTGGLHAGILALQDHRPLADRISHITPIHVDTEEDELDLLMRLVDIVRHHDPDILTGYEVHNSSWGYLIERARLKYDLNLCDEISRMKSQAHGRFGRDEDRWGFNHTSTIRVTGRHTINIWRAMRGELNLLQYTLENVAFHLLHKRVPHYSFVDLTAWYQSEHPGDLDKVIEYYATRVRIDLEILESNELVPRTSEQARLIGIDWFSVISRGSQFKVENIMFRIAKPENLLLPSPSRRQVGGQNALECLPLVMEPHSDFYTSPMLVLDFQSLYPSVMIAYNYCYSTFLGRITDWRGSNKMGFMNYERRPGLVKLLEDHVNIAPNGIMYVKSQIRKSLLAKMLSEILETRVMVKSGMKEDKDDKTLQRLLNNRQLALKLIANVTYGYTSASFSGRMPCSEIADSIVQTGRETLERAVTFIHSVQEWGAEVVYGDTDSLFVYLKGRTREQAFAIGNDIAKRISDMNPQPVKLKFEKVYHPCVLLAKKRYVGFKYEHVNQTKPEFEAKGIETVRRDGTPAEQKIEENALKILFRTADLSQVKKFFQAQCAKIMKGKVSIQDFCFAKEVKLGTYSNKGPPPPGALISARRMLHDPRLEPQYGERVPYVVVTGGPQARLSDRCVEPEKLLGNAQQQLDAEYYISKNIIPPLERIFNLVGGNVRSWYDEMPKYQMIRQIDASTVKFGKGATLESYMTTSHCVVCRSLVNSPVPICQGCRGNAAQSLLVLRAKLTRMEKEHEQLHMICRACIGCATNREVKCDSKDCPVFYSRVRHNASLASQSSFLLPVISELENEMAASIEW